MRIYFIHNVIVILLTCITSVWVNAQHKTAFEFTETADATTRRTMQNNVNAVFSSIHDSYFSKREGVSLLTNHATREAIEQIQTLWSTSRFYCTETEVIRRVSRINKGLQVRNIPVFFEQGGTDEDKYQDLVIDFTPDGRISDVYIAIPMHQVSNILAGNTVTDLRRRQLILGFVENFRTAYNRKDISYLDRVFSNDALIIVGKELKSSTNRSDSPQPRGVDVEYIVRTKSEYMENLRGAFLRNNYINIKFSDIEVMQHDGNSNIYGVTLKQNWNTTNYKDVGWLFLMIDFRDENNPLIWVRTWQPDGVLKNDVFGLDNFILR